MTNSVNADQMPQNAASDLGLHCLHRPVCLNIESKFDSLIKSNPLRSHPRSAPAQTLISGPTCSKLMMSLVNDSLKFTSSDTQIC